MTVVAVSDVRCNHLRRTQRPLFPTNISGVDAIRDDPTQIDPTDQPTLLTQATGFTRPHFVDPKHWFSPKIKPDGEPKIGPLLLNIE